MGTHMHYWYNVSCYSHCEKQHGGFFKKQLRIGTSLLVQWLGFPMQGAWVRSLVRELDSTCCNSKYACHH